MQCPSVDTSADDRHACWLIEWSWLSYHYHMGVFFRKRLPAASKQRNCLSFTDTFGSALISMKLMKCFINDVSGLIDGYI